MTYQSIYNSSNLHYGHTMSKKKKVIFIGPIADGSCPKCKVGTAIEDHTCPYAEEINEDAFLARILVCDKAKR